MLYDIDSGWNVEALAGAEALLDDLPEGWGVDAGGLDGDDDSDASDDDEDAQALGFEDDEDYDEGAEDEGMGDGAGSGMVWSVTEGPAPIVVEDGRRSSRQAAAAASSSGGAGEAAAAPRGRAERDLVASLPRHVVRQLAALQAEADAENAKITPIELKKAAARLKTHRGALRIIAGAAAGRRLLSPQGDQTRPMMEMVRGAVFNMIMSMHGCTGGMPEGSRWLDLFAGTGAVGLEALSRGCGEAHFVELSPWVVSNCLLPNLEATGLGDGAVVHTTKAEDFLRRATSTPRFGGGAFDFVSVCPPYELVSYPELYDLLEASPLLHRDSVVLVEYPKRCAHQIRARLGPLVKLRDRRYGRTLVALYGPPGEGEEAEDYE